VHEQFSIKASRLYERYKEWALDNTLKAMNGTAFGLEMKKRFEQKRKNDGLVYCGIALRASEGLHADESPSRAASTSSTAEVSVGSVPFSQKLPLYTGENEQKESYKEVATLPTLTPPTSMVEAASQGARDACRPPEEQKEPTPAQEREVFYL